MLQEIKADSVLDGVPRKEGQPPIRQDEMRLAQQTRAEARAQWYGTTKRAVAPQKKGVPAWPAGTTTRL